MSVYFFDSSGLVKRFTREVGSAWVLSLFKPSANNKIYTARIAAVEVVAAIERRKRGNTLTVADADKALQRFERSLTGRYRFVELRPKLDTRLLNFLSVLN